MADQYSVYILEAIAPKSQYKSIHVGIAKDVQNRIRDHRLSRVKATRGRDIKWLGNSESMDQSDALRLEIELKKKPATAKLLWASQQQEHA